MLNFGIPEILKINFVLKSKTLNIKIGKEVIRCEIIKSGFFFFNNNVNGIKEKKKIKIYEILL
jgi:hypothetical protein